MPRRFNILATTERITVGRATSELWMLLRAVGDETPTVDRSGIRGVIVAQTTLDPTFAVEKMTEDFRRRPETIYALFRVIPIQRIIPTEITEIVSAANELASAIPVGETFRVTVEKRRTVLGSHQIIEAVAEVVDRSVRLEEPDWVILVETMGKITGVSVVRPVSILNVQKERARLSSEAKKSAALHDQPDEGAPTTGGL